MFGSEIVDTQNVPLLKVLNDLLKRDTCSVTRADKDCIQISREGEILQMPPERYIYEHLTGTMEVFAHHGKEELEGAEVITTSWLYWEESYEAVWVRKDSAAAVPLTKVVVFGEGVLTDKGYPGDQYVPLWYSRVDLDRQERQHGERTKEVRREYEDRIAESRIQHKHNAQLRELLDDLHAVADSGPEIVLGQLHHVRDAIKLELRDTAEALENAMGEEITLALNQGFQPDHVAELYLEAEKPEDIMDALA